MLTTDKIFSSGYMIDKDLIQELDYHEHFLPIFRAIEREMKKLDAYEIRSVIGDRLVDRFEDGFIRVIYNTFKQLEK